MRQCPFPALAEARAFTFWVFEQERSTFDMKIELLVCFKQTGACIPHRFVQSFFCNIIDAGVLQI